MHHKRRRRRQGAIKGHCFFCSLRTTNGTRNGRVMTFQERASVVSLLEGVNEYEGRLTCRPRIPVRHGYTVPQVGGPFGQAVHRRQE
jgi:hypothetical protein